MPPSPPFLPLSDALPGHFPSTRYQGSKVRLLPWIWQHLAPLEFSTCLDLFGGTGAVAYRLKQEGRQVTYNDYLHFNVTIGRALIENSATRLSSQDLQDLLSRHRQRSYPSLIQQNFAGIYFTDEENAWLDQTITNIRQITHPYKAALAFFALCQACLVKRPYNLFHRKNLYLRLAQVQRSFGNKTSWDRPFEEWFPLFVQQANNAVFDNGLTHRALQYDALETPGEYDLVYIDPPYLSAKGNSVNYLDFYHFLEGLTCYEEWPALLNRSRKHLPLQRKPNPWNDKRQIHHLFQRLFARYQQSILVVSYRSDGIPSPDELRRLLQRYKKTVRLECFGRYQYALSTNSRSEEILLLAT